MAIDREDSLRKAEKLLRQGRLDAAIQEYSRLLEEQPTDWNTRNVLGDLYVRANQVEQAAAQFTKIADHFAEEGFLPRAIALYKKVVKIKPDDERALLQSAEINARQGLLVDAKSALASVADQRRRRGDKDGSNEILIRIATLDPADLGARMSAARAAAEMGDTPGAATRYKEVAGELFQRDRAAEAIDALAEAVHLDPADESARDSLVGAYLERGEIEEARRHAATGFHYRAIADELSARGLEHDALDALFEAVQRDPGDSSTRVRLVRSLIAGGEVERATACLLPENLGDDPELLLLAAEVDLRTGRKDAGRELLRAVIERDARRRAEVVQLGCRLTQLDRDLAFECVDVATDAAVASHDCAAAAAGLQEFLRHGASHIPALIKLVDVCVDGDLDDIVFAAQAELAEAYLAGGRAFEARVIAEDLVSRVPGDKANIDRFRRALVLLGEADPDAIIADRLSADSSFQMEDLNAEIAPAKPAEARVIPFARTAESADAPPSPAVTAPPPMRAGGVSSTGPLATLAIEEPAIVLDEAPSPAEAAPVVAAPAATDARPARSNERVAAPAAGERARADRTRPEASSVYDLGAMGIDINAVLSGERPAQAQPAGQPEAGDEVDLSAVLTGMGAGQSPGQPPPKKGVAPAPAEGHDLDDVFEQMRHEVVREQSTNTAAQHYKLALSYHDMGMQAECIKALETAARSPRYRFQAASLLARIHRRDGRTHEAIDWFERAAEAPASSVEAGRALLYELGQALEDEGEAVRALAVYLELRADAGDYRDVPARIKRLSR